MDAAQCTGLSCRQDLSEGAATEVPVAAATPDASANATVQLLKVVCGDGSCVPDDKNACSGYVPPPAGGAEDSGSGATPTRDAGSDALDAGVSDAGRESLVDGSYTLPTPPGREPSGYACQLALTTGGAVERSCGASGTRDLDEACTSSLDCLPGLGCVGPVRAGRCLPFCCGIGADSCEQGSYCAQRPLRSLELGERDGPMVPVCDRAENCNLAEPANCTGEHCVCPPLTACSVVRMDTTACVQEGGGVAGDPCPCKWGFHCSQATSPPRCVKTCEINIRESCGAQGICQSTPLLPQGWGTCVGTGQMPTP
jgi:hypothetical protein